MLDEFAESIERINIEFSRAGDYPGFLLASISMKLRHNRISLITQEETDYFNEQVQEAKTVSPVANF